MAPRTKQVQRVIPRGSVQKDLAVRLASLIVVVRLALLFCCWRQAKARADQCGLPVITDGVACKMVHSWVLGGDLEVVSERLELVSVTSFRACVSTHRRFRCRR